MKRIYRCENHHSWVEDEHGPNDFRKPHDGCGGLITSAGWVKPEEEGNVFTCHICNQAELPHFYAGLNAELRASKTCFMCRFWLEKVTWRENNRDDCFVIEGHHYKVVPESPGQAFKGFGGRRFVIQTHDGRQIVTTNLWHQGDVPPHFRERLSDNAQFES